MKRFKCRFRPGIEAFEARECLSASPVLGAALAAVKPAPPAHHAHPATTGHAIPTLNRKVLAFAKANLGQQVGDGQCAVLAQAALEAAGAKNFDSLGPTGPGADYVWGRLVATETPGSHPTGGIKPGDILQFSNVQIVKSFQNGSTMTMTATHHTAIVEKVSGTTITVLQQNYNGILQVGEGQIELDGLQQGTIRAYRPIAR